MGHHPDYTSEDDSILFFLRLIFGVGGTRDVQFVAYKFDEKTEHIDESRAFERDNSEIYTLKTHQPADAYITTPFANGKLPLCFKDDAKKRGIVMSHEVKRVKIGDNEAINFIVDFPLGTLQAAVAAVHKVKTSTFDIAKYYSKE